MVPKSRCICIFMFRFKRGAQLSSIRSAITCRLVAFRSANTAPLLLFKLEIGSPRYIRAAGRSVRPGKDAKAPVQRRICARADPLERSMKSSTMRRRESFWKPTLSLANRNYHRRIRMHSPFDRHRAPRSQNARRHMTEARKEQNRFSRFASCYARTHFIQHLKSHPNARHQPVAPPMPTEHLCF